MKLTKKGKVDKRYKVSKTLSARTYSLRKRLQPYLVIIFMGILAGIILGKTLWDVKHPKKTSPKPLGQTIEVKTVLAQERAFCADTIQCIRDVGEELGRDNQTIMTMIRIARAESNFRERAKNPRSTASGVFQIIAGTWYSNDCVGDKWIAEDNIRCAYKIQAKRGFQPWGVCKLVFAKCY